ncbi:MAG: EamA/RhaT family transporter, partial [Thermoprotei archaeon]
MKGRGVGLVKGYSALIALTLLWGSTFPFIKVVVAALGFAYYVALRHAIAALALAPLLTTTRRRLKKCLAPGAVLGLLYFLGITLQGWGMESTTASNAA